MSAQDVQAKLDAATLALSKTTSSYTQMVADHGKDWTKWPKSSNWYVALTAIAAARNELISSTLKAAFTASA